MSRIPVAALPAPTLTRPRPRRDKRACILDAAVKVFASEGYHRARISDIAREAGIAYGLVYHYFRNKDEILDTLFEERWEGFLDAVEAIGREPGTLRTRLVSIAALILNAYRVRPDWVKVVVFEIQRTSRFARPAQLRAVGRLFDAITGILREAQATGSLRRDVDPALAGTLFIGAFDLLITSFVLGLAGVPDDETSQRAYYARVAQMVVEMFMNGIAFEPGAAS
jgi:AcrR family transcriptional regulator